MKFTIVILSRWLAIVHGLIFALNMKPSWVRQREAEVRVMDAFDCLAFTSDDKQHRVFSNLRQALDLDPQGTQDHIRELGAVTEVTEGKCPMPKSLFVQKPGESGLPMPE